MNSLSSFTNPLTPKPIKNSPFLPTNRNPKRPPHDRFSKYRGKVRSSHDYILIMVMYCVGFNNLFSFPQKVFENGGLAFVVVYFTILFSCLVPFIIFELGISQFYGVAVIQLYRCMPFFAGLGWCKLFILYITMVNYSYIVENCIVYLLFCLFWEAEFVNCQDIYIGIYCIDNHEIITNYSDYIFDDEKKMILDAGTAFYKVRIKHTITAEGTNNSFATILTGFDSIHLLSHFIYIVLVFFFTYIQLHMFSKMLYAIVSFSVALLSILIVRVIILPGSLVGIKYLFIPNFSKALQMRSIILVLNHIFTSMGVSMGVYGAFSCGSNFNQNISSIVIIIALVDSIVLLFSNFFVFGLIGFMNYGQKVNLPNLSFPNPFILVSQALPTVDDRTVWVTLTMLLLVFLCMTSVSISLTTIIISIIDYYSELFKLSIFRKNAFYVCFLLFYSTNGLVYSLYGISFYADFLSLYGMHISLFIIILVDLCAFLSVYKIGRLRLEFKMMNPKGFHTVWMFFGCIFIPLFVTLLLISNNLIFTLDRRLPAAAKIVAYLIGFIATLPFFVAALLEFRKAFIKEKNISKALKLCLHIPDHLGPYYKTNWCLDVYYQKKLVQNRKNPEFQKEIRDNEDLKGILKQLSKSLKSERIEKDSRKLAKVKTEASSVAEIESKSKKR